MTPKESKPNVIKREWTPHARQEAFLSIPETVFEALYGGAAGGGKSDTLLLLPLIKGYNKLPGFKGIIFRRTFPELEKEIIHRSHHWYAHTGAKYNADNKRWTWKVPGGEAIIYFGHMENENDKYKYDGVEYNLACFDELTSFTQSQYEHITLTRMRTSQPGYPVIVRSATNPGNVGHTWVKDYFVKPEPKGNVLLKHSVSGEKRIFIPCTAKDNPYIDPNYIKRLSMLPKAEREAKLDGSWDSFEGQVFQDFRKERLIDEVNPELQEPENALHVIPEFKIPFWWRKVLAVDWGYAANTAAMWGAISPEGRLYVYREYVVSHVNIVDWSADIKRLSEGEEFRSVVICRSAKQNRGESEGTILEQFNKNTGLNASLADNRRVAGKMMIQEFLRFRKKNLSANPREDYDASLASYIFRTQGSDKYKEYCESFLPEKEETNLPKLQIFDICTKLIETIPACVYADPDGKTGKESEDVKEFKGDDLYDAFRYLIMESANLLHLNNFKDEQMNYRAKLEEELSKTKDYVHYHMQLSAMTNKRETFSVRRFSRRAPRY